MNNDHLIYKVSEIEEWVRNIRRDFHEYPELGMEEYRTQAKIIE